MVMKLGRYIDLNVYDVVHRINANIKASLPYLDDIENNIDDCDLDIFLERLTAAELGKQYLTDESVMTLAQIHQFIKDNPMKFNLLFAWYHIPESRKVHGITSTKHWWWWPVVYEGWEQDLQDFWSQKIIFDVKKKAWRTRQDGDPNDMATEPI